jgi:hypothetical protein
MKLSDAACLKSETSQLASGSPFLTLNSALIVALWIFEPLWRVSSFLIVPLSESRLAAPVRKESASKIFKTRNQLNHIGIESLDPIRSKLWTIRIRVCFCVALLAAFDFLVSLKHWTYLDRAFRAAYTIWTEESLVVAKPIQRESLGSGVQFHV